MKEKQKSKKKNRLLDIIGVLILLFGLGVFLYPIVANFIVSQQTTQVTQKFNQETSKLSQDELDKLLSQAKEYNNYIYSMSQRLAYPKAKPDYNKMLMIDSEGIMGNVSIPQIKVSNIPVYHGDSEKTLELGIGHIPQTSLPIGGENTHTVLSAHSGRSNNTLFTNLDKLKKNDVFYINTLNLHLKYKIDDIKIVKPEDVSSLSVEKGKDLATLVTCYPTGVNTHRLLVTGERIPYTQKTAQEKIERNPHGYDFWVMVGSAVLALIALIIIVRLIMMKRKEKRKENK